MKDNYGASNGATGEPPRAGAKARPGADEAKPMKVRKGAKVAVVLSGDNPRITKADGSPASLLIDQRIRDLAGWRGETLARMRALILEADPEMTEEWKWMGTPVWSHHGIVCTGEAYKKVVKLTFARGACDPGPIAPLQFQPRGQHAKGDRHPRRGEGRRGRVQGAREGRGGPEWCAGEDGRKREGQARCE